MKNMFESLSLVDDDNNPKLPKANSLKNSHTQNVNPSAQMEITPVNPKSKNDHIAWPLVWIDLEMTGLNIEKDRILEIACIVTNGNLTKVVEGPNLVIHQSNEALEGMGEWCQTHHAASGLIESVRSSKLSEEEAEMRVLEFVQKYTVAEKTQIAGNSVYQDLNFLRKYMPKLAAHFSHVIVDVSSVRSLCLRWFPRDAEKAPSKKQNHRALDDIKESIAELAYFRKTIFKQR